MLKNTFYHTVFMTMILLVFALLGVSRALAVTFTVNSILDQPDDLTIPGTCHTAANTCTLRAAVMQANRTSGTGATIIVPPGVYTLTIPRAGVGGEENGDLDLTPPASGNPIISIIGAGDSTTIVDGNQLDRVFHVYPNRTATISGVTIRNGFMTGGANAFAGGINNEGSLTVIDATITLNRSTGIGGGIWNGGNLTVMNSTISQNIADVSGGGIRNDTGSMVVINSTISQNNAKNNGGGIANFGNLNMSKSTLSGNSAVDGGGIINGKDLTVTSSTISQNSANNNGGGIHNFGGTANIYSTSIVFNSADADADPNGGTGGGVYNQLAGTFNLRNTLVAGNYVSGAPVYEECGGTLTSFGKNMIGTDAGSVTCTVTGGGLTFLNSLLLLGPLQHNGGSTWTHALLPGSNAIDGGDPIHGCVDSNSVPLATDQRGAARVVGVRCDIGAFEYGAKLPWLYLPLIKR